MESASDRGVLPFVGFANPGNIEDLLKDDYRMLLLGTNIDLSGGAGRVLDVLKVKARGMD